MNNFKHLPGFIVDFQSSICYPSLKSSWFFVKQLFARIAASHLKAVVENFNSLLHSVAVCMFLRNITSFYRSIQRFCGNKLRGPVIMPRRGRFWKTLDRETQPTAATNCYEQLQQRRALQLLWQRVERHSCGRRAKNGEDEDDDEETKSFSWRWSWLSWLHHPAVVLRVLVHDCSERPLCSTASKQWTTAGLYTTCDFARHFYKYRL